jgi:glycosyltransferase involved in cell wall biosynthesis
MPPMISVVMPTRNRAEFILPAIKSVLMQSINDLELIIVDDCSSDRTCEIVNSILVHDSRIKLIRNGTQQGGAGARNIGIMASFGNWIAFIDDDDEWMPNKLECQIDKLMKINTAVACSCSFEQYFPSGRIVTIRPKNNPTLNVLLNNSSLGGASMCLSSKKVICSINGFDAKFKSGQDWDLWVRLREQGDIVVSNEILVHYTVHEGARISNNMDAQYQGSRRFYFKHRNKMDVSIQRNRKAYCSYIMSRQQNRRLLSRLKYLIISVRHSEIRIALNYLLSSFPRIVFDGFSLKG